MLGSMVEGVWIGGENVVLVMGRCSVGQGRKEGDEPKFEAYL